MRARQYRGFGFTKAAVGNQPRFHHRAVRTFGVMAIVGCHTSIGACAAPLEDPARFYDSATEADSSDADLSDAMADRDVVNDIFLPKCAGAGCHGASRPAFNLDLVSPGVTERLLDVGGHSPGLCSAHVLVAAADPIASLMVTKLEERPPCGVTMPPPEEPRLTDEEIDAIVLWVQAAAGQGTVTP